MKDGRAFRVVVQFNGVYEMGPVSEPAYPDTSISARSLEALEALEAPEIVPETEAAETEPVAVVFIDEEEVFQQQQQQY